MPLLMKEIELKSRINRLGWTLVIMLGVIYFLAFFEVLIVDSIFMAFGSEKLSIALGAVMDSILYMSYFIIPSGMFYLISKGKSAEPIGFAIKLPRYLPLIILSGIGICLGAGLLNDWFCEIIGYSLPADDTAQYMSDPEIFALYMTLSLSPAFAEELLFRGVVYPNLRPYGKTFAVLVSAILFALMHENVGQFFYIVVAGIVMALIYEATGSIWGGVLLHMANNLYAVLQTAVVYRFDEATSAVILYMAQAILIFLGAISTICLLCIQRKRFAQKEIQKHELPAEGVYDRDTDRMYNKYEQSISVKQAVKSMLTAPGMVTYLIMSVISALFMVLMYV